MSRTTRGEHPRGRQRRTAVVAVAVVALIGAFALGFTLGRGRVLVPTADHATRLILEHSRVDGTTFEAWIVAHVRRLCSNRRLTFDASEDRDHVLRTVWTPRGQIPRFPHVSRWDVTLVVPRTGRVPRRCPDAEPLAGVWTDDAEIESIGDPLATGVMRDASGGFARNQPPPPEPTWLDEFRRGGRP